jgi:hypothetical protein
MWSDFEYFARMALSGEAIRWTKPPNPLAGHRAALIKRLRYEHVSAVITRSAGILEIKAAVAAARPHMPNVAGAKNVQGEAVYRDYREVADARAAPENWHQFVEEGRTRRGDPEGQKALIWPGPFYLPTPETCDLLGWTDLADAFRALSVADDAPQTLLI